MMTMRTSTRKLNKSKTLLCFVCQKTGNTRLFTNITLKKCRKILENRITKAGKYQGVHLPSSLHQKGYHIDCYKRFIGVKSNEIVSTDNKEDSINEDNFSKRETDQTNAAEVMPNQLSIISNSIDPDISNSVILKSMLMRKSPIVKGMTHNSIAFSCEITGQSISNLHMDNLDPPFGNKTSLIELCVFCGKVERKFGMQSLCMVQCDETYYQQILMWAKGLGDYDLMDKVKRIGSYHDLCRIEYRYKYDKITDEKCGNGDWVAIQKKIHEEAFDSLCAVIDEDIIENHKTYSLSDLYDQYKESLNELKSTSTILPLNFDSYSVQNLEEDIVNRYYRVLEISTSSTRKKVVHKIDLKPNYNCDMVESGDLKFEKLALELRNDIRATKRSQAVNSEIPDKLVNFVGSLMLGPDARRLKSFEDIVRIKYICKDIFGRVVRDL